REFRARRDFAERDDLADRRGSGLEPGHQPQLRPRVDVPEHEPERSERLPGDDLQLGPDEPVLRAWRLARDERRLRRPVPHNPLLLIASRSVETQPRSESSGAFCWLGMILASLPILRRFWLRGGGRKPSVIHVQFEADRPDRDDDAPIAGPVELAPQIAHLHVDDVGVRRGLHIPNLLEQHRPRDGLAGVAHEVFEQPEFHRMQLDQLAFAPDRSLDQVHFQVARPEPDDPHIGAPARQGLDPRDQFANVERFAQIAVAAGFQSGDSFIDGGEFADDQDRSPISFTAQRFDDRKSVLAMRHSINDEDRRVARTGRQKPLGQRLRNLDRMAARLQFDANILGQFAVVLNEENPSAGIRPLLAQYGQIRRRRKSVHRFDTCFCFALPARLPQPHRDRTVVWRFVSRYKLVNWWRAVLTVTVSVTSVSNAWPSWRLTSGLAMNYTRNQLITGSYRLKSHLIKNIL